MENKENPIEIDIEQSSIEFKLEQHSMLNDFEVVISMGAGIDHVYHTDDLTGYGTRLDPLGISEDLINSIHSIDNKLDRVDTPNIVYGTDENGDQTTYDVNSFGKIEDVQLNGVSVVENKIANIEPEAQDIAYTNEEYPDMRNLQDAMDKLLYVAPTVSISGGGNYEIGSTRATTTLTWTWNKRIVSQSLNQGIGSLDPSIRTYTFETPISSNTTFTIIGSDGTQSKSASTSVNFMPRRYWGVSANTTLTDEEIIALSSELSTTRQQTRTFNCSGGKYFYFVIKTSYCNGIAFKVGGLSFSDMIVETRPFTNASGHRDLYNIYRVNNIQTGSAIQVEVL